MNYFIDFEATQFSNDIISIGCIDENGEEFYSLINPGEGKLTSFITELTGITNEMLNEANSLDVILKNFFEYLKKHEDGDCNFYCYGNCDIKFIDKAYKKATLFEAKAALGLLHMGLKNYAPTVQMHYGLIKAINLQKVINHIRGVEIEQHHNALEDAIMLKEVYDTIHGQPREVDNYDFAEWRITELPVSKNPVAKMKIELSEETTVFMSADKKGNKIYGQYATMDEAVENIMRIEKMNNVTPETAARVANKIKNAAKIKKRYCDKYWFITK